jgi:predicted enzyme related to lactoylglutathione lyase
MAQVPSIPAFLLDVWRWPSVTATYLGRVELKSRGVTFETGVLEYPWGLVAVFVDPDGNRLQLREGRQAQ